MAGFMNMARTCTRAAVLAAACAMAAALPQRALAQQAAGAAPPALSALPFRRDDPDTSVRAGAAWAIGIALAVAAAGWVALRRSGRLRRGVAPWGARAEGAPQRRAQLALTQQAGVHVVRWADAEYLLGVTPQSVTVLDKRVLPPQGAAPGEGGPGE